MTQLTAAPRLLITGASGFIGSFLAERGLELGYEVWVAVRKSSSRRYLQNPLYRFFELNLSDDDALREALENHRQKVGAFAAVIHAAGATKARSEEAFNRINAEGTARLARLLLDTQCLDGRFVFLSSLSVNGAPHEESANAISASDVPVPNTAYGRSKLLAEQLIAQIPTLNYITLRPTGVYGPREKDYFILAKSIKQGIDFEAGFAPQTLSFIYVKDLVEAAFAAIHKGIKGKAYPLSDGMEYGSRVFSDLVKHELGKKHLLRLRLPLCLVRAVCATNGFIAQLCGKTTTLNADKYRLMAQRNWRCDISDAQRELLFVPRYPLSRGVPETIAWYKAEGWL